MPEKNQSFGKIVGVEDNGNVKSITLGRGQVVSSPFFESKASVVNRFDPTGKGQRYNSNDYPIYEIEDPPRNFHDQVRVCRDFYQYDPMTGTIIDIMIQFSAPEIQHVTDDPEVKQFFDDLVDASNLNQAIKWILLEYYVVANAFPYRSLREGEFLTARSGRKIPHYEWTVLNPEYVEVEGSMLFNQGMIKLRPSEELVNAVKEGNKNPLYRSVVSNLPAYFIKAIKEGESIPLDPNYVSHISRNKQPFERYGKPFLLRAYRSLRIKQKLIQLDLNTADGIINQLVTITTGNDQYPATQEDLDALAELINTPSKAFALLWNHTLNVKFHRPDHELFDAAKYEQVNRDIQAAFGITRAVFDDQEGGYGKTWVSIASLIERLEWGRNDIKRWLEEEYRKIAEEQGLPTYPSVRFSKINLQEDRTVKNILLNLYQHGVLSAQTLMEETGYNFDIEIERMLYEKKLKEEKGVLVHNSPYQQSKNDGGRPVGVEDSEPRERTPTPAPHGSSSASEAVKNDILDNENIRIYERELMSSFDEVRENLKNSVLDSSDQNKMKEYVPLIVAVLASLMNTMGSFYIRNIFRSVYRDITSEDLDDEAENLLSLLENENSRYVNKFRDDLISALESKIDNYFEDKSRLSEEIDRVFISMTERLKLFSSEPLVRSGYHASTLAHRKRGYTTAIWQSTFQNTCEHCLELHGRSFPIDQVMDMFPLHVNCGCYLIYVE